MFCKQGVLKKSQSSQESTYAGVSFNKVAGPEACFPVNFAKLVRTHFYRTASVAATDYSGLYNFVSNSKGTCLFKQNYLDFIRI